MLITNDLLYSNYICNYAWFGYEKYSSKKIIEPIYDYNQVKTKENNYMRENFADTFFSVDDCSKIGYIREDIESKYKNKYESLLNSTKNINQKHGTLWRSLLFKTTNIGIVRKNGKSSIHKQYPFINCKNETELKELFQIFTCF